MHIEGDIGEILRVLFERDIDVSVKIGEMKIVIGDDITVSRNELTELLTLLVEPYEICEDYIVFPRNKEVIDVIAEASESVVSVCNTLKNYVFSEADRIVKEKHRVEIIDKNRVITFKRLDDGRWIKKEERKIDGDRVGYAIAYTLLDMIPSNKVEEKGNRVTIYIGDE